MYILTILNWLRKFKLFRKINKFIKISTLITIISQILNFIPLNITFRILWVILKIALFIVGATTLYFTSAFG